MQSVDAQFRAITEQTVAHDEWITGMKSKLDETMRKPMIAENTTEEMTADTQRLLKGQNAIRITAEQHLTKVSEDIARIEKVSAGLNRINRSGPMEPEHNKRDIPDHRILKVEKFDGNKAKFDAWRKELEEYVDRFDHGIAEVLPQLKRDTVPV